MRKIYSLLAVTIGLSVPAIAQYTSYDFEPVAGTRGCSNITIGDYNSLMKNTGCFFGDTQKTGYIPQLYLLEEDCEEGKPFSGKFFVGISSSNNKSDKLSLKLAEPTVNYRIYSMVIHIKKPQKGPSIDLELGYSFDCDKVGTVFETIGKPADSLWDTISVALAPPVGTKYITISGVPVSLTSKSFTYIDDVQVSWVPTGIDDIEQNQPVNVYPNPFGNTATFSVNENMVLPCEVTIYDMTGRRVYQQGNINTRGAAISKGNLNTGMYLLEVKDSEGRSGRTRVMIE